jgi:DNA-binding transcriptional regulator YiaG
VTLLELRAMLARVDAGKLREDAGIRQATVGEAFGVPWQTVGDWERGRREPYTQAGYRWVRFVAALERRAEFAAEAEKAA